MVVARMMKKNLIRERIYPAFVLRPDVGLLKLSANGIYDDFDAGVCQV